MKKTNKNKIDPSLPKQLQDLVVEKFGKAIEAAPDCELLSHKIEKELEKEKDKKISAQTLRRFFGLIKNESNLSKHNLYILSRYCGFSDFVHFRESFGQQELQTFFGAVDNTKSYWQKSEELCQQIMDSTDFLVQTHYNLMAYPNARNFFLENHPMRDMLGSVYSQYFLDYLKYNTSNEAKIFAYGFLFQSAFMTQNEELMDLYYRELKNTTLSAEVHVIPAGMKFGLELLYEDKRGEEALFQETFQAMKKSRISYIARSQQSICGFEYTALEALVFSDRKEEIRFLLENTIREVRGGVDDYEFVPFERKETCNQVWNILCAICYHKIGDEFQSNRYLKRINRERLGIGWKNYYSILHHLFLLEISDSSKCKKNLSDVSMLVEKGNFSYFRNQLQHFL